MTTAVDRWADLVNGGICWILNQPSEDEDDIGGAVTLFDALEAADKLRARLRRLRRDELLELAVIGLAAGIYDGEIDRNLRKVARGESYSRFPAPPSDLAVAAAPAADRGEAVEADVDLAAIAVEERIEEEAERGVRT